MSVGRSGVLRPGSVMVGYVHGGLVRAEFMASVLALMGASPLVGGFRAVAGKLIALNRNILVSRFLASSLPWLWCVDTDMVFAPDALERLLAVTDPEHSVVGALCYAMTGEGQQVPSMYQVGRDQDGQLASFTPYTSWPESGLFQVDSMGAACMLVHRGVLEKIQRDNGGEPCWFRETVAGRRDVSEDLSFCMRATESGFSLWVNTEVQVGHVKPVMLGKVT